MRLGHTNPKAFSSTHSGMNSGVSLACMPSLIASSAEFLRTESRIGATGAHIFQAHGSRAWAGLFNIASLQTFLFEAVVSFSVLLASIPVNQLAFTEPTA